MTLLLADPDVTLETGRRLGRLLRAGDLVVLTGGLGAGKTTLTRGIGEGMAVRGAVTSPTFVIARIHPALGDGPELVHVDAYRLGGVPELDDLDLDTELDEAVTVVEWGAGLAEGLAEDRLEITLVADPETEERTMKVRAVGARWSGFPIEAALQPGGDDEGGGR